MSYSSASITKCAATAEPRGHAEIARHAADQEARLAARRASSRYASIAGRRGLAVRAGDRQHLASAQHVSRASHCGPETYGEPRIEQCFDRRVAARHRVADHDASSRSADRAVPAVIALHQRDAERFELRAHRRVDACVGALDLVAQLARERGDAAHEGAADAEDVQAHRQWLAAADSCSSARLMRALT